VTQVTTRASAIATAMRKSTFIYLGMVFLFVFAQIGLAKHSTSHWIDCHQEQHQDDGSTEEQCGQCLSLSHVEGANLSGDYHLALTAGQPVFVAYYPATAVVSSHYDYVVRAPPKHSQV